MQLCTATINRSCAPPSEEPGFGTSEPKIEGTRCRSEPPTQHPIVAFFQPALSRGPWCRVQGDKSIFCPVRSLPGSSSCPRRAASTSSSPHGRTPTANGGAEASAPLVQNHVADPAWRTNRESSRTGPPGRTSFLNECQRRCCCEARNPTRGRRVGVRPTAKEAKRSSRCNHACTPC